MAGYGIYGNYGNVGGYGFNQGYNASQPQPQLRTNKVFVTSLEDALNRYAEPNTIMVYRHQDEKFEYEIMTDIQGKKTYKTLVLADYSTVEAKGTSAHTNTFDERLNTVQAKIEALESKLARLEDSVEKKKEEKELKRIEKIGGLEE